MKTLESHTILYDNECPLCGMYTGAFVNTGMLPADGRHPYQQPAPFAVHIDQQRSVNEIALVNKATGEVTYGIHSLFKIVGNAFPFLNFLFKFRPFVWLMQHLYAFISYNRKVIIPARVVAGTLQPSFSLQHRLAWLLFTWLITATILTGYAPLLKELLPPGGMYRELAICGGQIIFQGIIIALYRREKAWEYLGNMMTISFAAALLLLPLYMVNRWINTDPVFNLIWFLAVAGLMFLEHLRRCKILDLDFAMSVTWATYRLLILLLLLI